MSFSRLFSISFLLFFILLRPPPVLATRFRISRQFPQQPNNTSDNPNNSAYFDLASPSDQLFGLSSEGSLTVSLSCQITPIGVTWPARLALCQASDTFVRAPSYRRRQSRPRTCKFTEDVATTACESSSPSPSTRINSTRSDATCIKWCVTQQLCNHEKDHVFSVQQHNLEPNQIYLVAAVLCNHTPNKQSLPSHENLSFSLEGQAHFLNPNLIFPELGYEEVLFPIFAAIITALLAVTFLSLLVALLVFFGPRLPFRHVAQYVLIAALFKLVVAVITFAQFFKIAKTGFQESWFMYARLLVGLCADTLFIFALMCIASGFGVMPNSWFVEDRSPIFIVYITVVLQLLIFIAVKVMFPFQFLGAVVYAVAGSAIAALGAIASRRNYQFLERYGHLIEQSHIFLKSTPIPRLRRFYILNVAVLPVAYAINIVSVILFDYTLSRPDLFWGTLETVDAVLLVWLAIFVFPRPKSPLYVDMSHVSNDRLHQAERWRARELRLRAAREGNSQMPSHARPSAATEEAVSDSSSPAPGSETQSTLQARWRTIRQTLTQRVQRILHLQRTREIRDQTSPSSVPGSTVLDLNTGDTGDVQDPQPPWIAWTSGMSLPRPSVYTWRGRLRSTEATNPGGNPIPLIYTPIVIGSPDGSSDVVMLRIGIPLTGVNATPKVYDEKGNEVSDKTSSGCSPVSGTGGDDLIAERGSRLSLSERLRLSSLRLYKVDRHTAGQAADITSPGTQGRRGQGTVGSSGQSEDSGEDAGTDEVTRDLSGSTIIECSDGTITTLDIR